MDKKRLKSITCSQTIPLPLKCFNVEAFCIKNHTVRKMSNKVNLTKYYNFYYNISMGYLEYNSIIFLDYLKSEDPAEIDQGIRDTIKGIHLSNLTMGIALSRIKSEKLFLKLKFKSMRAYINKLCEDTGMEQSSVYRWKSMGEVFIKYRTDLEKIGFSDKDSPTKLPYLERALALNDKQEVFHNLIKMSQRDFADFARSEEDETSEDAEFAEVRGSALFINGKQAISVSKKIDEVYSRMLMKTALIVCRAMKRKGHVVAVHLRNSNEARRFKIEAERIREEIQSKRKMLNHK